MFPLRILRPLRTRDYTDKCFPLMWEKCSETRIGDSQVINTILPTVICICQPSVTVHWSNIFKTVGLPFKHMSSRLLRHAHAVEDNTTGYKVYLSRTLLLLLLVNKMWTVSHKHNPWSYTLITCVNGASQWLNNMVDTSEKDRIRKTHNTPNSRKKITDRDI